MLARNFFVEFKQIFVTQMEPFGFWMRGERAIWGITASAYYYYLIFTMSEFILHLLTFKGRAPKEHAFYIRYAYFSHLHLSFPALLIFPERPAPLLTPYRGSYIYHYYKGGSGNIMKARDRDTGHCLRVLCIAAAILSFIGKKLFLERLKVRNFCNKFESGG